MRVSGADHGEYAQPLAGWQTLTTKNVCSGGGISSFIDSQATLTVAKSSHFKESVAAEPVDAEKLSEKVRRSSSQTVPVSSHVTMT